MSSSNSRVLIRITAVIAVAASAAVLAVWLTGGFRTDLGPLRVSMRGIRNPIAIATAAWLLLAYLRRHDLVEDSARLLPFLDRHGTAIAVVLAACCAGAGVRFGIFAANATDSSAYISHSHLLVSGPLIRTEPLVRAFDWYNGAWNFSPLGYRPGVGADEIVPLYPLGLPAVMALLRLPFGELGAYLAVPLLAALLVLGTYWLTARVHSRVAGLVAAALTATSPIVLFHSVHVMSDVPSAAWLVLAILAARGERWPSAVAAGGCLGMLGATRPNLAPLALVVVACAVWPVGGGRWRWSRIGPGAIGLTPVVGTVMWGHLRMYGSPFSTGYGGVDQYFTRANIVQNVFDYSRRIAVGETAMLVLVLGAAVLWFARRGAAAAAESDGAAWSHIRGGGVPELAAIAAGAMGVLLALYLPYGIFPDWAYLRFLLPGLATMFVLAGALAASSASRLPPWIAGPLLVVAVAVTCAANVRIATREQAFNLYRYESRYRTVGLYLKETLPPNAVVVTFQESGAIHYYTGVSIVRWDYLPNELDDAVNGLRSKGLHPLLVVEDWELPMLRERFPRSRLAALDWTKRADIGETTHVWILDPEDRGAEKKPVTDVFR
jgi:hypothetical protein